MLKSILNSDWLRSVLKVVCSLFSLVSLAFLILLHLSFKVSFFKSEKQCSGSMIFWRGSMSLQDDSKKLIFKRKFFCLLLFEGTFTSFSKKLQNSRNQGFSYFLCLLIEGSGSGPFLWLMDPDSDPGVPKTCGSGGSGSEHCRKVVFKVSFSNLQGIFIKSKTTLSRSVTQIQKDVFKLTIFLRKFRLLWSYKNYCHTK